MLFDDSYNANPISVQAAAEFLASQKGESWLVLGDMAELGEHASAAHAETGRLAAELNLGQLLVTGEMAGITAGAARASGLHRVLEFANTEAVSDALSKLVRPGDLILLKASRRMRLERVMEAFCVQEKAGVY